MSLSDCPKCQETPCRCGYGYAGLSVQDRLCIIESIAATLRADLAPLHIRPLDKFSCQPQTPWRPAEEHGARRGDIVPAPPGWNP